MVRSLLPDFGRLLQTRSHRSEVCMARESSKSGVVRKVALEVIADETPPNGPRHANIIGWPVDSNDPEEQKSRWKDLANVIAKEANLVLR